MFSDPSCLMFMPVGATGGDRVAGDSPVNYNGHWLAASQWMDDNVFQGSAASTADCYGRYAAGTASGLDCFGNTLWLGGKVILTAVDGAGAVKSVAEGVGGLAVGGARNS